MRFTALVLATLAVSAGAISLQMDESHHRHHKKAHKLVALVATAQETEAHKAACHRQRMALLEAQAVVKANGDGSGSGTGVDPDSPNTWTGPDYLNPHVEKKKEEAAAKANPMLGANPMIDGTDKFAIQIIGCDPEGDKLKAEEALKQVTEKQQAEELKAMMDKMVADNKPHPKPLPFNKDEIIANLFPPAPPCADEIAAEAAIAAESASPCGKNANAGGNANAVGGNVNASGAPVMISGSATSGETSLGALDAANANAATANANAATANANAAPANANANAAPANANANAAPANANANAAPANANANAAPTNANGGVSNAEYQQLMANADLTGNPKANANKNKNQEESGSGSGSGSGSSSGEEPGGAGAAPDGKLRDEIVAAARAIVADKQSNAA